MAWVIYLALIAAYASCVRRLGRLGRMPGADAARGARIIVCPRQTEQVRMSIGDAAGTWPDARMGAAGGSRR